jgi:pyrroline-5-carboxylate reductase
LAVPWLLDHPLTRMITGESTAMTTSGSATSGSTTQGAHSLKTLSGTILLVGAGKMGGAMLEGWLALGIDAKRIAVLEPQPTDELAALARRGVTLNPSPGTIGEVAAVVVAVKPQVAPEVMPTLRPFVAGSTVVVSIMAGRTLQFLAQAFPRAAVVRTMPNLPAAIGRGITVAVANEQVTAPQRELVHALLSAVGAVEWLGDEALMDAVVAVSGSGPAYVFLLAETMAQAGVAAGLPPALAATLARATVAGSGEMLQRSPLEAGTLRQNVTSPGGTTAAALDVLMAADGMAPLMRKAIASAARRSRELAG